MAFCGYCGARVTHELARFCTNCGMPLVELGTPQQTPPQLTDSPLTPATPAEQEHTASFPEQPAHLQTPRAQPVNPIVQPPAPPSAEQEPSGTETVQKEEVPQIDISNIIQEAVQANAPPVDPPPDLEQMKREKIDSFQITIPEENGEKTPLEVGPPTAPTVPRPLSQPATMPAEPPVAPTYPRVNRTDSPTHVPPPPARHPSSPPVAPTYSPDSGQPSYPRTLPAVIDPSALPEDVVGEEPGRAKGLLLPVLIIAAVFILLVGGGFGILAHRTSAATFTRQLGEAITSGNNTYLYATLADESGRSLSTEAINAICAAFREPEDLNDLKSHLLSQSRRDGGSSRYDAFELKATPYLGLFRKYSVTVKPVTLQVESNIKNIIMTVNGEEVRLEEENTGWSVQTLPGRHTIVGQISSPYSTQQAEVVASYLSASGNSDPVTLEFEVFEVTISCPSSGDVKIYLNDVETDLQPVDQELTVPGAEPGMVVRAVSKPASGDELHAQLTIGGPTAYYALQFTSDPIVHSGGGEGGTTGGTFSNSDGSVWDLANKDGTLVSMTREELDGMVADSLARYYGSYIKVINDQDISHITGIEESYRDTIRNRMGGVNAEYIFDFHTMTLDRDSFLYQITGGVVTAQVNARFEYRYRDRDGNNWSEGSSLQVCLLVYEEGSETWKIRSTEVRNSLVLGDNVLVRYA